MPNKHAAIKDLRKNIKHEAANSRMKTHVKALTKQLKELMVTGKKKEAQEMMQKLQQAMDKASRKHVLSVNKTGRNLSKAHKLLSKMA